MKRSASSLHEIKMRKKQCMLIIKKSPPAFSILNLYKTLICPYANGHLHMDNMGSDIFIFKFK
jgi:hypothetical protein